MKILSSLPLVTAQRAQVALTASQALSSHNCAPRVLIAQVVPIQHSLAVISPLHAQLVKVASTVRGKACPPVSNVALVSSHHQAQLSVSTVMLVIFATPPLTLNHIWRATSVTVLSV